MITLFNDSCTDFRNLSIFEVKEMTSTNFIQILKDLKIENAIDIADELSIVSQNLKKIEQSVKAYSTAYSKMSRGRKFFSFLNLTDYKIQALTQSLSTLTETVEKAKVEAEAKAVSEIDKEKEAIATKLVLVEAVYMCFQAEETIRKSNSKKPNIFHRIQRLVSTTKKVDDETAKEVDAYFQRKIQELKKGKNAALPNYYHSTPNRHFNAIVKSKRLKQFNAVRGLGAYVSTNIEYQDYGCYAFALEASSIHLYQALYCHGTRCDGGLGKYNSMWVRVKHEIPIRFRTVAHVTVGTKKECSKMQPRLKKLNLNVPVITRIASNHIANLFDEAGYKICFSEKWSKMN